MIILVAYYIYRIDEDLTKTIILAKRFLSLLAFVHFLNKRQIDPSIVWNSLYKLKSKGI